VLDALASGVPPHWARPSFTHGFPGSAFTPQPDGTLRCPAGHPLYVQERRPERNGSLRVLYAARIGHCRPCPLREQCQESGTTLKPRRVSAVFWPRASPPDGTALGRSAPICDALETSATTGEAGVSPASAPPVPNRSLPEQSVPIGDSPGSNGSLAMPALLRLLSWRLPFTGFLRRLFSLLTFLSNRSPDSSHFPLCLFSNSSPPAISFVFAPVSLTHSIASFAPFLHHLNQLVSLMSLAWLHLIAYPVGK
jgi:hypothetical protein